MRLHSCRVLHRLFLAAAVGSLPFSAVVVLGQGAGAKSADPTKGGGQIRSVDDRVRIEPYQGEPIFLEEKKSVVPPSMGPREPITDKFSDGSLRLERQIAKFSDDHYESDGYYREYHPGGKKFIVGQFRQGRREGDWSYWFENGQLNRKVTYKNGQLNGSWDVFRADGTLASKQSYAIGLRDGMWIIYDDVGKQQLREEHYSKGKIDGNWKTWYPNGKPQQEASFKEGQRHGMSTAWKDDGSKTSESNWVEGKLEGTATTWSGTSKTVRQFKNGLLVSEKKE